MGRGLSKLALGAIFAVAGCKPAPVAPVQNQVANEAAAPAPSPAATSAAVASSPMAQWIVGSWSFEESCATDFIVHYKADGTLQNGEDSGTWALAGDAVTETIGERFEMGSDAPQKLDPPEKRTYTVTRIDAGRGSIAYRGKKIPIRRC